MECVPFLMDMNVWRIGNGKYIHAWKDCWVSPEVRIVDYNLNIPLELQHANVYDIIDDNGEWNWTIMSPWMSNILRLTISANLPPTGTDEQDVLTIAGTPHGQYKVRDLYKKLHLEDENANEEIWENI